MFESRRWVGFVVITCLSAFQGCSQHTTLEVRGQLGRSAKTDLERLLKMLDHKATVKTGAGLPITAYFAVALGRTAKLDLGRTLDRLLRLKPPAKSPVFSLEVTETRENVLKILKLAAGKRHLFPLKLRLGAGDFHLKRWTNGDNERLCTYDVPLADTVPALSYTIGAVEARGKGSARARLLASLSNLPLTAKHRVAVSESALKSLAASMNFQSKDTVTFVFETHMLSGAETMTRGLTIASDIAKCAKTVLHKASDSFYSVILFPALAGEMVSYSFGSTRW